MGRVVNHPEDYGFDPMPISLSHADFVRTLPPLHRAAARDASATSRTPLEMRSRRRNRCARALACALLGNSVQPGRRPIHAHLY